MSDRARKDGKPPAPSRRDQDAPHGEPLYSHIRELDPSAPRSRLDDANIEATEVESAKVASPESTRRRPESGFFAHAARISMGTAFPALRSVARFLSLETYRSLPKHDKLPDLDDIAEADLDDLLESPSNTSTTRADQLLDWDELEVEEVNPTPYQRYLFELRIKGYLRQTKEQLSPLLLIAP